MKLSANEAISVVDKLTKLDMKSATSAQELAQALSKVANSARLAKVSQDEILGILSVGIETTQQSGDVIGTAVRSLLARFSNVKASKFGGSGEETEGTLNDTEAVLSKIGIRIRNASGEMRSFMDVLDDVAEKWDTLDDVSRNAISTAMAGTRQKEIFASIIENYDRVKELIGESANAAGTADEKYSAYMDSMEAATKRLQNAWEGFTQSLETSTVMKFLTNSVALLVENADKLKYIVTGIAAASSLKIFDFFTNKGETGGWKGLVASIPFIGRGTKTNNILESIDKKVGNIEKGVGADALANQTKNGGFFKRLGGFLKTGFGRSDIYDPETGKSISWEDYKKAKIFYKQYKGTDGVNLRDWERTKKLVTQRRVQNAAMGAISAVATNLLTTKQVGAGQGGLIDQIFGINKALAGGSEQTVEETLGGKIGRAAAAGGLSALGGALFGPLGAMIGQVVGEGAASIVSTIIHRSELEMKQRVADAKEQLKMLESINSTTENGKQIMSERFLDSSGYKQLNEYVKSLSNNLMNLDASILDKILGAVRNTGKTTAITISQLANDILNSDSEDRKEIQKVLEIAIAEQNYNQLIASQEEVLANINKTIQEGKSFNTDVTTQTIFLGGKNRWGDETDTGEMSRATEAALREIADLSVGELWTTGGTSRFIESIKLFGNTPEELISNANKLKQIAKDIDFGEDKIGKAKIAKKMITDYADDVQKSAEKLLQLNKELRNSQIQIAYLKSGISDLTQNELADLTIDGVVGRVVKSLEDMGIAVRDVSGVIKSEYLTQIKSMIQADSDMAILTKSDTKRIGELETAWSEFVSVFGDASDAYEKVKKALDTGTFEEYLNEHNIRGDAEALEKLVYTANPERIEQFASAWNMTTEAAKELAKTMPNLTTAMGLMSTTEISEKMSKIATIFSDLSENGKLTVENFNAILKNYPEYVNQLGDYEALIGSLGKTLTDESFIAYKNALLTTLMGDEGYYKKFKEQLPKELSKLLTETNAKTLTDVLDLAQTNDDFAALNGELEKFLNQTYELEIDNPLRDLAIEVKEGLLDKQISNLNEQKNALSQINDERKKELEYIKAKIALEDAQKEKKRVYVQGVGWTYRVDETAVSEAREKLDSLDVQRQQDAIQLQIDSLEQQKEILEAIKNNEQLEKIEEALGKNGISTKVEDIAQMMSSIEFNPMTGQFQMFAASEKQKRVKAVEALEQSNADYEEAVKTMNKEWSTAGIERQQELYDAVKQKYEKYSKAYTTASGLGADVSDYSENGKIKPNAADSKSWDHAKFVENVSGFESGASKVSFFLDGVDYGGIKIVENELSGDNHNRLNDIVKQLTGKEEATTGDLVYLNGHLYIRRSKGHWAVLEDDTPANQVRAKYFLAKGSLSSQSGLTMLNEFGTEGIITPQGTLTALPSKTGVVPADITKNVWALGEVAPTLVASLRSLTQKPLSGNVGNTTYEEGQYIDNLIMNVYPTKDYDMDKLLREARAKVNLTRHNN